MAQVLEVAVSETPSLGWAAVAASSKGLCALYLDASACKALSRVKTKYKSAQLRLVEVDEASALLQQAIEIAHNPLLGPSKSAGLPLDLSRGTPFQQAVWHALLQIPLGEVSTYGEIAQRIGKSPSASRAVGAACGANFIAIIVPCHRVVAANNQLGGYNGGLDRKKKLLQLEMGKPLSLLAHADTSKRSLAAREHDRGHQGRGRDQR